MIKSVALFLLLSLALSSGQEAGKILDTKAFINKRAKRTIDASKQIVLIKTDVTVDVLDNNKSYAIVVPLVDVPHLASMQVKYSEGSQSQVPLVEEYIV